MMGNNLEIRALVSGAIRVANTLAGIVLLGIALDWILGLQLPMDWKLLGFVPLVLGIALEASGTRAFWRYGRGTPNPEAHPERLVTEWPYSWSRHPLYLARHLILIGFALLLGSLSILVLTAILFIVVERVMIPREEGRLAVRFGEPYETYRSRVSKWVTLRSRGRE